MSIRGTNVVTGGGQGRWGRVWWAVALRGVVLVAFGLIALIWPVATAAAFYWILAIFLILDGMLNVTAGAFSPGVPGRGWSMAFGALCVVLGVAALVWPSAGATVLYLLLVIWALLAGIIGVSVAWWLRRVRGTGWGWAMTWGILAIVFAIVLLFTDPLAGLWTVATVFNVILGIFAIVAGVLLIMFGFRVRRGLRAAGAV